MCIGRALLLFTVGLAASGATLAQSAIELYRRVTPLEATTGVISIRESVERGFDVPETCEDGSMDCTVPRLFGRVWRIDFENETRRLGDEELFVQRQGRGTAYLALAAGREDEERYAEELREALGRLVATAFDEPYAGLRPDRRPFDGPVAARSAEPSWSCFENDSSRKATRYSRELTGGDEANAQVTGTSSRGYGEEKITEPLCSAMADATEGALADVVRTMSTPRMVREEVLSVVVSDSLPREAYADELTALPDGAWLARRETPGVGRSEGMSTHNEILESRITIDEVETSARLMPASLPAAAARAGAWHSRWTLETFERHLGPLPDNRLLDSWSLTASLMPTLPPRDLDEGGEAATEAIDPDRAYPVRLDQAALFASVGGALDFGADLSPEVVADAIVRKIDGLKTEGWILVICRSGGEATWGLSPTTGRSPLLNGEAFCGAVESRLP